MPTPTCFGNKLPSLGSVSAAKVHRSNIYFRHYSHTNTHTTHTHTHHTHTLTHTHHTTHTHTHTHHKSYDSTLVLKHVEVGTWCEMCFVICCIVMQLVNCVGFLIIWSSVCVLYNCQTLVTLKEWPEVYIPVWKQSVNGNLRNKWTWIGQWRKLRNKELSNFALRELLA